MNSRTQIKILITGGHITPAAAVIEQIRKRTKWDIVLVGRAFAFEGDVNESEEERVAQAFGVPFIPLTTGRVTRYFSFKGLISLGKIPIGFLQALRILRNHKPTVIVSFGGYIAFPVVLAGWMLHIPIVTHEQTRIPGLANRLIASISDRMYVSFADQVHDFVQKKTVWTGLPIRPGVFEKVGKPNWISTQHLPILYITGGSSGSVSLNTMLDPILPTLLSKYIVIHQTGKLSYQHASEIKQKLPHSQKERYHIFGYIPLPDYAWIIQHCDLIIGRSGANTVGEAAAVGKIALWIPLPWSSGNEQLKNAQFLADQGTSMIAHQYSLTPKILEEKIDWMVTHKTIFQKKADVLMTNIPRNGAAKIVDSLSEIVTR